MKTLRLPGLLLLMATTAMLLAGCGNHDGDRDHDHAHAPGAHAETTKAGHHHESAHGGVGIELGEHQFFLDVLATPENGTLELWVMDGHAENFIRVPWAKLDLEFTAGGVAPQVISLQPQASTASGETLGDTSYFRGSAAGLKGQAHFTARIPALEIRGSTFRDVQFDYPAKH